MSHLLFDEIVLPDGNEANHCSETKICRSMCGELIHKKSITKIRQSYLFLRGQDSDGGETILQIVVIYELQKYVKNSFSDETLAKTLRLCD